MKRGIFVNKSARKYFDFFIKNNFDLNNDKVYHKLNHTYCVVKNAKYICEDMKLSSEDTNLAMIIALLHDIGRFEQAKQMETFREDITTYDHATLGIKLLFELNEIRNFVRNDKYDEIIKKAIGNHSRYILEESGLTEKEKLHCKIIRDADKMDSFRAKATEDIYTMANIYPMDIEDAFITEKVFNDFMSERTIFSKERKTGIDIWISYIALIFGLEFNSSLKFVQENNYINKLFDRFQYRQEKEKMEILKQKALAYINNKLKSK